MSEQQLKRHNEILAMCDAYGSLIKLHCLLLSRFGLEANTDEEKTFATIADLWLRGELRDYHHALEERLQDTFWQIKEAGLTANDVSAVWSIIERQI